MGARVVRVDADHKKTKGGVIKKGAVVKCFGVIPFAKYTELDSDGKPIKKPATKKKTEEVGN